MRRQAVLIGSNNATSSPLRGVDADITRIHGYLTSEFGGAWRDDEITMKGAPTVAELKRLLSKIGQENPDFLFIAFSGHGFEASERSMVCLRDGEDFNVANLQVRVARQVTFVDACRFPKRISLTESVIKTAHDVSGVDSSYRASCRQLFDRRLQSVPQGRILVQACSSGEFSADEPSGGLFTTVMFHEATFRASRLSNWRRCEKWSSVSKRFSVAYKTVQRINGEQHPVLRCAGDGLNLPFFVA